MNLQDATPLVLVGGGKMGGAMLAGWLDEGLDPAGVTVIDPGPPPDVAALLEKYGIVCMPAPKAGSVAAAVVVLAVKPQIMDSVLPGLSPVVGSRTLVLSIAAGKTISTLEAGLATTPALVRAMPNTPAMVLRGITVACPNPQVDAGQKRLVSTLLSAIGAVEWIDDEALMDAVTGLSGSGPAYVFHLVEAMAAAGEAAGLPADLAMRLARATVSGAGELMHQSDLDVATLRENVTSKGGTTAAALSVLMAEDGLGALLKDAVAAATERSRDLAE